MKQRKLGRASIVLVLAVVLIVHLGGVATAAEGESRVRARISGTILTPEGQPLEGATLSLKGKDGVSAAQSTTNASGYYDLGELAPGEYEVELTLEGFRLVKSGSSVTILPDGQVEPPLVDVLFQTERSRKKMWQEILLFIGIAATGGLAAL